MVIYTFQSRLLLFEPQRIKNVLKKTNENLNDNSTFSTSGIRNFNISTDMEKFNSLTMKTSTVSEK